MAKLTFHIEASLDTLPKVCELACGFAEEAYQKVTGCQPEKDNTFISAVELAVGEACTNAIRHRQADGQEPEMVYLEFSLSGDTWLAEIRDHNQAFDFLAVPEPDFAALPESGYGIYLIRSLMDEVWMERQGDWNVLHLAKKIVS